MKKLTGLSETAIQKVMIGDGNVFAIIGRVKEALKKKDVSSINCSKYANECFKKTSYDEVLVYSMDVMRDFSLLDN